ncbi:hypothetical protein [Nannocystis pusilla]|uniref:hypothetical protein n=1 Tax=Nannocystis pusilla TaxID=889268 RepID=UPI003B7828F6
MVTLSDDQDYTVAGHLSMKLGGDCGLLQPRTLQVLLHGGHTTTSTGTAHRSTASVTHTPTT